MAIPRPDWDEVFMMHAIFAGVRSSCLKRQVGAVLVRDKRIIASGYNGAPADVPTCLQEEECFYERIAYEDSQKGIGDFDILKEQRKDFCNAVHAEQNALNQCAKHGVPSKGTDLYCTNYPCPGCVKNIIQAGVVKVVVWKAYLHNPLLTHSELTLSSKWLGHAGIKISKMDLTPERIQDVLSLMPLVGERLGYQFVVPESVPPQP